MSPILTISGLHKSFGKVEVLKGIDLTMQQGDVVSLIGSSGSGKTTLLRCVNLLEDFEQGSIELAGQSIGYKQDGGQRRRLSE
ncbi:MAG: amino acid ABC transporter ATP-binding protein, partial [Thalassospira sp.]|nr:amino acid ABC transporter ATP-binding protein [Thalassospira sp.]